MWRVFCFFSSHNNPRWKYLIIAAIASLPGLSMSQDVTVRFDRFTMDQQMSQNSVYTMMQDTNGFLWLGTQDGLNRFDGYTFKQYHFTLGDSTSLADDHILSLYEAYNQLLWVGTKSGGLHRYEPETESFTRFHLAELLQDSASTNGAYEAIHTIREIGQDSLLLGTAIGVVFFDVSSLTSRQLSYSAKPDTAVRVIEIDTKGHIWIGNNRGELYRSNGILDQALAPGAFSAISISSRHRIESIFEDHHGDLWIATLGSGIFKYDVSRDRSAQISVTNVSKELGLVSDSVNTVILDQSERLWIGYPTTGLGLSKPGNQHNLFSFDPSNALSLTHNTVYSLLIDQSGILWIGTWNGLNKLSPQFEAFKLFTHFQDPEGRLPLDVVAIEEDRSGIVWLGTMSGNLISYNPVNDQFKRHPYKDRNHDAASIEIFDIAEDSDQLLWIATLKGGVHTLDSERQIASLLPNQSTITPAIKANENVPSVLVVDDENIWFGTMNEGLKSFNKKSLAWIFYKDSTADHGLTHSYIWPMLKTRNGEIWVGAYEDGLYKYIPESDSFESFHSGAEGLTSNRIFSLFEDAQNTLWAGTAEGLNRIDRPSNSFSNYQPSDGLPHSRVVGIQEDNQGYLWLSTNNGLSRFNTKTKRFENYYIEDGLQGNRFFARSAHKLSDGRLLFGGPGGINVIDPEKLHTDNMAPTLRFTRLDVDNEPVPVSTTSATSNLVQLNHNSRIEVNFSMLDFTNTSENSYYYKLDRDENWNNLEQRHFLTFNSLEYGNHTLFVRGENNKGTLSNEIQMPIFVQAPLWRRPWFQVVLVLIFICIVVGLIVLRTRYILGIQNVRLGIAKSLHDDLGANLSTISIQTGVLQTKSSIGDRERQQLERVSNMARETAHKVREAVWLIDSEYDTLDRLVAKMRDLAMTMFDGHTACHFTQDPLKMPAWKLKMNFRQNVYYLVKEALNNANKSAEASSIAISIHLIKNQLNISIKDDGNGFSMESVKKGNGINFMQQRADEIKGQLEIQSTPGNGTSITLDVAIP